jgi:hypothetical protein
VPLTLRGGRVTAVQDRAPEIVRLLVDGHPCIAFPDVTGPVEVGDDVLVNVQARELELGSGGFDVLHANLTRGLDLGPEEGAHVMVLPYTSIQRAVVHAEEQAALPESLDGRPVVCCSLHSQVGPVCAALAGARVGYVQVAGGAMPVGFSDTVRLLRARGLLATSIAAGPCTEGELQAVNVYSALLVAAREGCDVVVCAVGPGIVGTGTPYGHGGVAAALAANAAGALGGRPVLAVRASEADPRPRHRGVSHHTRAALELVLTEVVAAWPVGRHEPPEWLAPREEVDASGWRAATADLPLSHMGRTADADPLFFEASFAAGLVAAGLTRPAEG